jgi:hypothetical protein
MGLGCHGACGGGKPRWMVPGVSLRIVQPNIRRNRNGAKTMRAQIFDHAEAALHRADG